MLDEEGFVSNKAIQIMVVAIIYLSFMICIPLAERLNKKLQIKRPDVLPYIWGYYVGLTWMFTCIGIAGLYFFAAITSDHSLEVVLVNVFGGLIMLILAIPFMFILKRQRWALVLGTLMTLITGMVMAAIVVMLVNITYIKRRWKELKGGA